MTSGYHVRPVTLDDAEAYVRCHVECLAETYAAIMPPEFAELHRATVDDRVTSTRDAWSTPPTGPGPHTRSWIATDAAGHTVGVARSGPGPQPWEAAMGAPLPSVGFQLHHVYTRRSSHGTGLGRDLLDVALGGEAAYLWILRRNPRAERFYRRHGFVSDGAEMSCGPSWFHRPMFRMTRSAQGTEATTRPTPVS